LNSDTKAIVVNVTDTNDESPVLTVATPYSVAEGATIVGTVTTTDADAGATTSYSLTGTDSGLFTINSDGDIVFATAPDFETPGSSLNTNAYSLNVVVSDGDNSDIEAIIVNVTNTNDNIPVFTSSTTESINEGQTSVSTVIAGDDDGDTIAYSIDSTGRVDHALFSIDASTGALTMAAPDF
jgi:VCBS repeat-containing protein